VKRVSLIIAAVGFFVQVAQAEWTPAKRLTSLPGSSGVPAVAIDSDDYIHVIWADDTPGNYEIYHKRSMDGGTTWNAIKRLTWNSGTSYLPAIAIDSSNAIHVVWYDSTPGQNEIYYKRSTDEGTTWNTMNRLTWNSGFSTNPGIAIDSSGAIHVVWQDNTPGNYEIYYRKFIK